MLSILVGKRFAEVQDGSGVVVARFGQVQDGTSIAGTARTDLPARLRSSVIPAARILVADDHELVRKGLLCVLGKHPEWEICGEASTGRQAVAMAVSLEPDVVVLDIGMPELNGLEAARLILARLPATEVVILTVHESDTLVHEVLDAGARGYVLKSDANECLVAAVESVLEHEPFLTSSISRTLVRGYLGARPPEEMEGRSSKLTPREREILQLLAQGRSNKDVATVLDISVKTAETHRTNIMRKLDLHCIADLVRYAIRTHVVDP